MYGTGFCGKHRNRDVFYSSYIDSYIDRDIKDTVDLKDGFLFRDNGTFKDIQSFRLRKTHVKAIALVAADAVHVILLFAISSSNTYEPGVVLFVEAHKYDISAFILINHTFVKQSSLQYFLCVVAAQCFSTGEALLSRSTE